MKLAFPRWMVPLLIYYLGTSRMHHLRCQTTPLVAGTQEKISPKWSALPANDHFFLTKQPLGSLPHNAMFIFTLEYLFQVTPCIGALSVSLPAVCLPTESCAGEELGQLHLLGKWGWGKLARKRAIRDTRQVGLMTFPPFSVCTH